MAHSVASCSSLLNVHDGQDQNTGIPEHACKWQGKHCPQSKITHRLTWPWELSGQTQCRLLSVLNADLNPNSPSERSVSIGVGPPPPAVPSCCAPPRVRLLQVRTQNQCCVSTVVHMCVCARAGHRTDRDRSGVHTHMSSLSHSRCLYSDRWNIEIQNVKMRTRACVCVCARVR
eukprot:1161691-Pelagomonas_calceolata.AAC.9